MKLLFLVFLVFFLAPFVFADNEDTCDPEQDLTEPVPPLKGQCDWYPEVCCEQVEIDYSSVVEADNPCNNDEDIVTPCLDKMDLLGCMNCKPGVEIINGSYVVCPSFADEFYEACKENKGGPDCTIPTREEWDKIWFSFGWVIKEDAHCFSSSSLVLPSFVLGLFALVF